LVSAHDAESAAYELYHQQRFSVLSQLVSEYAAPAVSILDVGPGPQTLRFRQSLPAARITTLGIPDARFFPPGSTHYDYDLNRSAQSDSWPSIPPHDIIVLAEVVEHLAVPPRRVLAGLRRYLTPAGVIILQTPNAVCLWKRLEFLRGCNPAEALRESSLNPGHLREYTLAEILEEGRLASLEPVLQRVDNYFGQRSALRRALYDLLCSVFPGVLRDGITVVFRQSNTAPATSSPARGRAQTPVSP
jgi:hypothetical protein